MSSKEKTPNLNLNLWDGSDKPKRADFNYDNEILDSVIAAHINNADIHMSQEETEKLNSPFIMGSYIGDGASTRIIKLSFTPSFIVVFASSVPFSAYDKENNKVYSFGAAVGSAYGSSGIQMGENSFTVIESTGVATASNYYPRMNTSGYRYQYIAFR